MTDETTTDATTTDKTTFETESTGRAPAPAEGTKDDAFDGGSCEDVGALLNAEEALRECRRSCAVRHPRYCPTAAGDTIFQRRRLLPVRRQPARR